MPRHGFEPEQGALVGTRKALKFGQKLKGRKVTADTKADTGVTTSPKGTGPGDKFKETGVVKTKQ